MRYRTGNPGSPVTTSHHSRYERRNGVLRHSESVSRSERYCASEVYLDRAVRPVSVNTVPPADVSVVERCRVESSTTPQTSIRTRASSIGMYLIQRCLWRCGRGVLMRGGVGGFRTGGVDLLIPGRGCGRCRGGVALRGRGARERQHEFSSGGTAEKRARLYVHSQRASSSASAAERWQWDGLGAPRIPIGSSLCWRGLDVGAVRVWWRNVASEDAGDICFGEPHAGGHPDAGGDGDDVNTGHRCCK